MAPTPVQVCGTNEIACMDSEHEVSSSACYAMKDLLFSLGGFGRYQRRRISLMMFIPLTICFISYTSIFSLLPSTHTTTTTTTQHDSSTVACVNGTTFHVYPESTGSGGGLNANFSSRQRGEGDERTRHFYMESTATEDFKLICDKDMWITVASDVFFLGQALGALIAGQTADRIGRRPTLIGSQILLTGSAFCSACVQDFSLFLLTRLLVGGGFSAAYLTAYSLMFEMLHPKHVLLLGFVYECVFALGLTLLAIVAYCVRSWRQLQFAVCLLSLPAIPIAIWSPESLRWLITSGNVLSARRIAREQAVTNRVKGEDWKEIINSLYDQRIQDWSESDRIRKGWGTWVYVVGIARTRTLNLWVGTLCFCWFVICGAYYGISSAIIPGNLYWNVGLSGVIPMMVLPLVYVLSAVFSIKRKTLLQLSLFLCGLCCSLISLSYSHSIKITQTLAQSGRTLNISSFALCYVYSLHLIPTSVRSSGLALCLLFGRVGSFATPWLNLLSTDYWGPCAFLIYGTLLILSSLSFLVLKLPHVESMPMQETLEDSSRFAKETKHTETHPDEHELQRLLGIGTQRARQMSPYNFI